MKLIGFHATRSGHRASLTEGLRIMPGAWDHASGGELGNGFYVISEFKKTPALYTYGYAVASTVNPPEGVDIWSVFCSKKLSDMTSMAVPNDLQWHNIPVNYCSNYDWLYNANEVPPVQVKFNPRAYRYLKVELCQSLTFQEAEAKAFP
ncbi:hypothetical protein ABLG08_005449 [Pseudomonas aeruginosa]